MSKTKIKDKLQSIPDSEKATVKGLEIKSALKTGKYLRPWKNKLLKLK